MFQKTKKIKHIKSLKQRVQHKIKENKNQTHNHSTAYLYLEMISKSHNDRSHGTKVSKWCFYFRNSCNWSSFALSNVNIRWFRTSNKCNNLHLDCECFSITWYIHNIYKILDVGILNTWMNFNDSLFSYVFKIIRNDYLFHNEYKWNEIEPLWLRSFVIFK